MRGLTLNGDFIICSRIEKEHVSSSTFQIFNKEEIPYYQIEEIHLSDSFSFPFSVGDVVVSGSTGTIVAFNGKKKWLFRQEHILGKVAI